MCRLPEAGRSSALQECCRLLLSQPLCLCAGYTQVSPAPRQVRHNAADGSLVASGTANTICLQLAGGWLPLEDVSGGWQVAASATAFSRRPGLKRAWGQAHSHTPASYKLETLFSADSNVFVCLPHLPDTLCAAVAVSAVDVVGKYRYEAREPLGGSRLPLMLDVLLVGRTKMLRLHSCLWLENNTGMRLEPCLSLGSYCSTPVVLGPGDKLDSLQRLHLRVG